MENEMKSSVKNTGVNTSDGILTSTKHKRRSSRIQNLTTTTVYDLTESPLKLPTSESESKNECSSEQSTSAVKDGLCGLPDQPSTIFDRETENVLESQDLTILTSTTNEEPCEIIFDDIFEQNCTETQNVTLTKNTTEESTKGRTCFKKYATYSTTNSPESQTNTGKLETDDVSKVFKLISKPNLLSTSPDMKNSLKSPLKTYTNPRKSLEKTEIVETFGLPDNPIIPEKPLVDSILDAEILDAKEITIQDLQFVEEPWCIIDLEENFSNLHEIRIKADPQNHVKVCYSSKPNSVSTDSNSHAVSPTKLQNNVEKLLSIVSTKSVSDENILDDKTKQNKRTYVKKHTNPLSKPEVITQNNSLTLEEHEVEIFNSDTVHDTSNSTSSFIKTNKPHQTMIQSVLSSDKNETGNKIQVTSNEGNKIISSITNRDSTSSEGEINVNSSDRKKLRSSGVAKDPTPSETENKICSDEKRKTKSTVVRDSTLLNSDEKRTLRSTFSEDSTPSEADYTIRFNERRQLASSSINRDSAPSKHENEVNLNERRKLGSTVAGGRIPSKVDKINSNVRRKLKCSSIDRDSASSEDDNTVNSNQIRKLRSTVDGDPVASEVENKINSKERRKLRSIVAGDCVPSIKNKIHSNERRKPRYSSIERDSAPSEDESTINSSQRRKLRSTAAGDSIPTEVENKTNSDERRKLGSSSTDRDSAPSGVKNTVNSNERRKLRSTVAGDSIPSEVQNKINSNERRQFRSSSTDRDSAVSEDENTVSSNERRTLRSNERKKNRSSTNRDSTPSEEENTVNSNERRKLRSTIAGNRIPSEVQNKINSNERRQFRSCSTDRDSAVSEDENTVNSNERRTLRSTIAGNRIPSEVQNKINSNERRQFRSCSTDRDSAVSEDENTVNSNERRTLRSTIAGNRIPSEVQNKVNSNKRRQFRSSSTDRDSAVSEDENTVNSNERRTLRSTIAGNRIPSEVQNKINSNERRQFRSSSSDRDSAVSEDENTVNSNERRTLRSTIARNRIPSEVQNKINSIERRQFRSCSTDRDSAVSEDENTVNSNERRTLRSTIAGNRIPSEVQNKVNSNERRQFRSSSTDWDSAVSEDENTVNSNERRTLRSTIAGNRIPSEVQNKVNSNERRQFRSSSTDWDSAVSEDENTVNSNERRTLRSTIAGNRIPSEVQNKVNSNERRQFRSSSTDWDSAVSEDENTVNSNERRTLRSTIAGNRIPSEVQNKVNSNERRQFRSCSTDRDSAVSEDENTVNSNERRTLRSTIAGNRIPSEVQNKVNSNERRQFRSSSTDWDSAVSEDENTVNSNERRTLRSTIAGNRIPSEVQNKVNSNERRQFRSSSTIRDSAVSEDENTVNSNERRTLRSTIAGNRIPSEVQNKINSSERRKLRSSGVTRDSTTAELEASRIKISLERVRYSAKKDKYSSQPESTPEIESEEVDTPKRSLRSSSCSELFETKKGETKTLKSAKSKKLRNTQIQINITNEKQIINKSTPSSTVTRKSLNIPTSSKKKNDNNINKNEFDSTIIHNEDSDYAKQLTVVLHPLKKSSNTHSSSQRNRISNNDRVNNLKRHNRRFNKLSHELNIPQTNKNVEKKGTLASTSCEMFLELVDIIPISDRLKKPSKILQSKPFFNLFKNNDNDCSLPQILLNKHEKNKTPKVNRKPEMNDIVTKQNAVLADRKSNLASTSTSKEMVQSKEVNKNDQTQLKDTDAGKNSKTTKVDNTNLVSQISNDLQKLVGDDNKSIKNKESIESLLSDDTNSIIDKPETPHKVKCSSPIKTSEELKEMHKSPTREEISRSSSETPSKLQSPETDVEVIELKKSSLSDDKNSIIDKSETPSSHKVKCSPDKTTSPKMSKELKEIYKSPTRAEISRSPTKTPSKLKRSPEADAEITELKNLIKKMNESEGRRCKVVTNEKLSECLKTRQYVKKSQYSEMSSPDNSKFGNMSEELESKQYTEQNEINNDTSKESTSMHESRPQAENISPTEKLRDRTRKIIEMLSDESTLSNNKHKNAVISQKNLLDQQKINEKLLSHTKTAVESSDNSKKLVETVHSQMKDICASNDSTLNSSKDNELDESNHKLIDNNDKQFNSQINLSNEHNNIQSQNEIHNEVGKLQKKGSELLEDHEPYNYESYQDESNLQNDLNVAMTNDNSTMVRNKNLDGDKCPEQKVVDSTSYTSEENILISETVSHGKNKLIDLLSGERPRKGMAVEQYDNLNEPNIVESLENASDVVSSNKVDEKLSVPTLDTSEGSILISKTVSPSRNKKLTEETGPESEEKPVKRGRGRPRKSLPVQKLNVGKNTVSSNKVGESKSQQNYLKESVVSSPDSSDDTNLESEAVEKSSELMEDGFTPKNNILKIKRSRGRQRKRIPLEEHNIHAGKIENLQKDTDVNEDNLNVEDLNISEKTVNTSTVNSKELEEDIEQNSSTKSLVSTLCTSVITETDSTNKNRSTELLEKSCLLNRNCSQIAKASKNIPLVDINDDLDKNLKTDNTRNVDETAAQSETQICLETATLKSKIVESASIISQIEGTILKKKRFEDIKNRESTIVNNNVNSNEKTSMPVTDNHLEFNSTETNNNNDNSNEVLGNRPVTNLSKVENLSKPISVNNTTNYDKSDAIKTNTSTEKENKPSDQTDQEIVGIFNDNLNDDAVSVSVETVCNRVSKVYNHRNSLDEEVSSINELQNLEKNTSSVALNKDTFVATENVRRPKTSIGERLNKSDELVSSQNTTSQLRSKTSLGQRRHSNVENTVGSMECYERKRISNKLQSKTSLGKRLSSSEEVSLRTQNKIPAMATTPRNDSENLDGTEEDKTPSPRTRSKSSIEGRLSGSEIIKYTETVFPKKTRSKTSLSERITGQDLEDIFQTKTYSTDDGEHDENVSTRTRSKTSLGERIDGGVTDDFVKDAKITRSKTSLGDRIDEYVTKQWTEVEHRDTISPKVTRSRASLANSLEIIRSHETIKSPNDSLEEKLSQNHSDETTSLENKIEQSQTKTTRDETNSETNMDEKASENIVGEEAENFSSEDTNAAISRIRGRASLVDALDTRQRDARKTERKRYGRSKSLAPTSSYSCQANKEAGQSSEVVSSRRSIGSVDTPKIVKTFKRSQSVGSKQEMLKKLKEDFKKQESILKPTPGTIIWAQIGNYPYWPSLISQEPETGFFKKIVKKTSIERTFYHVRFFGDKGRRAWISSKKLMEYTSKDDLERMYNNLQDFKAVIDIHGYCVKPNHAQRWTAAVEEADFVRSQDFTVTQKIEYLEGVKHETDEDTILESEGADVKNCSLKKDGRLVKHDAHENIGNLAEITDREYEDHHAKKKLKLSMKLSPSGTVKEKSHRKKCAGDDETSEMYTLYSFPSTKKETKNEEPSTSSKNARVEEDILIRDEYSETEFKISVDTLKHFGSYSLEEQRTLFKRNNLFKGVPKEKVCQYCYDFGDILKCKGGCNGIYHPYCATQVLLKKKHERRRKVKSSSRKRILDKAEVNKVEKQETVVSSGNQSEVDEGHVQIVTIPSSVYETPPRNTFPPDFVNMSLAERIDFKMQEIMNKFEERTYADMISESSEEKAIVNPPSISSSFSSKCQNLFTTSVQRSPQQSIELDKELDSMLKNDLQITPLSFKRTVENNTVLEPLFKHVTADSPSPGHQSDSQNSIVQHPVVEHVTADTEETVDEVNTKHVTEKTSKQRKSALKHVTGDSVSPVSPSVSENRDFPSCSNGPVETKTFNGYRRSVSKQVTGDCDSVETVDSESLRSSSSRQSKQSEISENFDAYKNINPKHFRCGFCTEDIDPFCFICSRTVSKKGIHIRHKCSLYQCARFYHPDCLKLWPQTQWSLIQTTKNRYSQEEVDSFVCPQHVCHTCASDDPRAAISRCSSDKIVKCLSCPASYHSTNLCVPAGTEIITSSQIICPRHRNKTLPYTINTTWCLLCNEGGNLICCETCPTSVHPECMTVNLTDDDSFICEDCESGRLPLYDEVVWVKLGRYKWWPSLILFPNEVPAKVFNTKHSFGEFVVKFFGTYDYYWVNRGRAFLFQEGDTIDTAVNAKKKKVESFFMKAVEEAVVAHKMKKQFKLIQMAESANSMKPPPYIKIKISKPVGNVRFMELDLSNTTACDCDPSKRNPCGPDSNCLNRLLLTECNPEVCPAGKRCKNQSFEKREYPTLVPYKTETRGWGLKTLEPIKKGQFVIEYVGELIDDEEYQRRIQKMQEQKEENYYFLTIHKDRMIDAGPKGNMARFMNHCCQPNCETQKWTVNGDTRVGLFATEDILAHTELTFNYNLECSSTDKKICKCGAPNCSGFIGAKAKNDSTEPKKPKKERKKKEPEKPMELPPCFLCQRKGTVSLCNNKMCSKAYHLRCLKLKEWPEGKKFVCPWHYCNTCSKRTIRCCVKCLNSFCPSHSEGNVRYDKLMGFVCYVHDPTSAKPQTSNITLRKKRSNVTSDDAVVTSTTEDNKHDVDDVSLLQRCQKLKKSKINTPVEGDAGDFNVSGSCTSSPEKVEDESQDETVSSATVSDFEEEVRLKRKKKPKRRLQTKKIKIKLKNKSVHEKVITATNENGSIGSDAAR